MRLPRVSLCFIAAASLSAGGCQPATEPAETETSGSPSGSEASGSSDTGTQYNEDGTQITYCDGAGGRYDTAEEARAAGLSDAEFGATYCPEYLRETMHPSWDADGDGVNDCENDGSCDHTVDYARRRRENAAPESAGVE